VFTEGYEVQTSLKVEESGTINLHCPITALLENGHGVLPMARGAHWEATGQTRTDRAPVATDNALLSVALWEQEELTV